MDRGYGYSAPRSPTLREAHPARTSAGSLSGRDPYYDPYYGNPRTSGERLPPRHDPRDYDRGPTSRRAAEDYDLPPRRLLEPARAEPRPRGSSMVPADRRPLYILPPGPVERERLRPAVHSAGYDRRPIEREPYYVVPASPSRTGHGRHLSADIDPRPPRYALPARSDRQHAYPDGGRYHQDPRRPDEPAGCRTYDDRPRHLLPDHQMRPRAGSDVGAVRERPKFGPEYVRERPRAGPPPSTRGFDKISRPDAIRHEYRVPREDTASSAASSGGSAHQDGRRRVQQPITLHQDYEYGYSSNEESRNERLRPQTHHSRRDGSREARGQDDRYGSDTERHQKHQREPSARRDREKHRHYDETQDKHGSHRHHRQDSEEKHAPRRDEDEKRGHRSRHDSYDDDEERRRRHRERDERERDRDRDKERDKDRDKDRDRDKDKDKDTTSRIAETLGLGGAGAAVLGLAREAFIKRTGANGGDDERGDDGGRRRRSKRDETEEERKERHRLRRERETEEEAEDRHQRRRERREYRAKDNDNPERANRDRGDKEKGDREERHGRERDDNDKDKLAAPGAGAVGGAVAGAVAGRDKSRDPPRERSRDRSRAPADRKDGRRRRSHRRSSETDTSSSSSSEADEPKALPTRSRANSAARPRPAKGILKPPTEKFPDRGDNIREGVAPLKDAKSAKGIPANARWTKVDRKLVNPAALMEAQERFEERTDHVIILRVVPRDEIQKYAERTSEIREERHKQDADRLAYERMHDREAEEQRRIDSEAAAARGEHERSRRSSGDSDHRKPLAIEAAPHNPDQEAQNAVDNAVHHQHEHQYGGNGDGNRSGRSPMPAHPAYAPPPEGQGWNESQNSQFQQREMPFPPQGPPPTDREQQQQQQQQQQTNGVSRDNRDRKDSRTPSPRSPGVNGKPSESQ